MFAAGDHLFVLESGLGRCAVAICEYLRETNCRLAFVIVMDGPIDRALDDAGPRLVAEEVGPLRRPARNTFARHR